MLRKQILKESSKQLGRRPDEKNIAEIATVQVTSENANYPIENIFDDRRGPGGSHWVAKDVGAQRLIVAFDNPQTIRKVSLEIEEQEVNRTQELQLTVSFDGGQSYREHVRQEFNFSPPGTTFEAEEWTTNCDGVTHLQLFIKPDKGGKACRATITSLSLQ